MQFPFHLKIEDGKIQLGAIAKFWVRLDETFHIGETSDTSLIILKTVLDSLCVTILRRLPEGILKNLWNLPANLLGQLLPRKTGKKFRECCLGCVIC